MKWIKMALIYLGLWSVIFIAGMFVLDQFHLIANTPEQIEQAGPLDFAAMKNAVIVPITQLEDDLYFCRFTTLVQIRVLGRRTTIPQIDYIIINGKHLKLIESRVQEANQKEMQDAQPED